MEETLQHEEAPWCIGLPSAGSGNHRPNGPKADHALTFNPDHSSGADQNSQPPQVQDIAGFETRNPSLIEEGIWLLFNKTWRAIRLYDVIEGNLIEGSSSCVIPNFSDLNGCPKSIRIS